MKSKTIIVRILLELLIFIIVFSANDMLSWPSETTAVAVMDAVKKKLLEPICGVEVISAAHSGSFIHVMLFIIQWLLIFLFFFDAFALWQSRRKKVLPFFER